MKHKLNDLLRFTNVYSEIAQIQSKLTTWNNFYVNFQTWTNTDHFCSLFTSVSQICYNRCLLDTWPPAASSCPKLLTCWKFSWMSDSEFAVIQLWTCLNMFSCVYVCMFRTLFHWRSEEFTWSMSRCSSVQSLLCSAPSCLIRSSRGSVPLLSHTLLTPECK